MLVCDRESSILYFGGGYSSKSRSSNLPIWVWNSPQLPKVIFHLYADKSFICRCTGTQLFSPPTPKDSELSRHSRGVMKKQHSPQCASVGDKKFLLWKMYQLSISKFNQWTSRHQRWQGESGHLCSWGKGYVYFSCLTIDSGMHRHMMGVNAYMTSKIWGLLILNSESAIWIIQRKRKAIAKCYCHISVQLEHPGM